MHTELLRFCPLYSKTLKRKGPPKTENTKRRKILIAFPPPCVPNTVSSIRLSECAFAQLLDAKVVNLRKCTVSPHSQPPRLAARAAPPREGNFVCGAAPVTNGNGFVLCAEARSGVGPTDHESAVWTQRLTVSEGKSCVSSVFFNFFRGRGIEKKQKVC